jgi:hypothetical protein
MDNEKIKNFITSQRENGVPDEEIYSFLSEKGAIPQGNIEQSQTNRMGIEAPGIAKGLGKSALQLFQGVGELGQNIAQQTAGRVVEAVTGQPKEELGSKMFESGTEEFETLKDATKTETTGESIGKFVGDIAQFIIPATAVSRVQKGSSLASKIVGQALSDTGVQTAREGELNKDVRDTAILSLIIPSVLTGGQKAVSALLGKSDSAGRVINSLIKPASKEFSYGKNPGMAVAKEGIVANSLDDLVTKIDDTIKNKSNEYIEAIKKSNTALNISDSFKPIDEALDVAVKQNNQGLVNRLNTIKVALTNNLTSQVDELGNQIIVPSGIKQLDNISPEDLVSIKRDIGEMTAFTGNPSDDKLVNKALKGIYGNIKSKIDQAVPGSSEISERIASLISAKTATANRVGILARQNVGNFTGKVIGGAGAATSIFTGNPVPALIGLGIAGIENAMGTPAFKTRFAKFLSNASSAQLDELYKSVPGIRAVINREIGNND